MNPTTKHILGSAVIVLVLIAVFGIALPALVSASSDILVTLGVFLLIATAIGASVLVKHLLGLEPPNK
jgi:hypothetical protein